MTSTPIEKAAASLSDSVYTSQRDEADEKHISETDSNSTSYRTSVSEGY